MIFIHLKSTLSDKNITFFGTVKEVGLAEFLSYLLFFQKLSKISVEHKF